MYMIVAGKEPYRDSLVGGEFAAHSDSPIHPMSDTFDDLDDAIQAAHVAAAKRVDDVMVVELPLKPLPDNSGWDWRVQATIQGTL